MTQKFTVGARVVITGDHPHTGKSGTVDRYETIKIFPDEGEQMVVKLDDGLTCFVMEDHHVRPVRMHRMHGAGRR